MPQLLAASLSLILVLLTFGIGCLFAVGYLELPPAFPPLRLETYDQTHLQQKYKQLSSLATAFANCTEASAELERKIQAIVGTDLSPEDRALLAIWACREDTFWCKQVYAQVFFDNVYELGELNDQRSKFALWLVRLQVTLHGAFDGHIAEELVEAEQMQKGN